MWGMNFKLRKTHRSRTPHIPLTMCGLHLEVFSSLKLGGVTPDDKSTFKKQICHLASSIALKLVAFTNATRYLPIMMHFTNPFIHLFCHA